MEQSIKMRDKHKAQVGGLICSPSWRSELDKSWITHGVDRLRSCKFFHSQTNVWSDLHRCAEYDVISYFPIAATLRGFQVKYNQTTLKTQWTSLMTKVLISSLLLLLLLLPCELFNGAIEIFFLFLTLTPSGRQPSILSVTKGRISSFVSSCPGIWTRIARLQVRQLNHHNIQLI